MTNRQFIRGRRRGLRLAETLAALAEPGVILQAVHGDYTLRRLTGEFPGGYYERLCQLDEGGYVQKAAFHALLNRERLEFVDYVVRYKAPRRNWGGEIEGEGGIWRLKAPRRVQVARKPQPSTQKA